MRKSLGIAFSVVLLLILSAQGTGAENKQSPAPGATFAPGLIKNAERTELHGNIAHYRYDVVVGSGQFDTIRLHRVVKEGQPYRPVHTVDGVLLLPGNPNYFEAIYMAPLISSVTAWDHSIVVFLAKNNIDVWGMDYGWALVPAETIDFSFMKEWGVEKDTRHAEIALSIARSIRGMTGQGSDRLHLMGLSYGGIMAYSVAGDETQKPHFLRHVKGIIPIDFGLKLKEENLRAFYCSAATTDQANLDAGVYNDDFGLFANYLSGLALTVPGDSSPIIPGLTNYQAALFLGTSTELLTGQFWHFVGGFLDENGIPNNLRFTEPALWLELLQNTPPHCTMQSDFDVDATLCGNIEVPFDDHLGEITVPILYVGAGGGFGEHGYYTTELTASKDVTKFTVSLTSEHETDFGHGDNVLATDAEALVWRPILEWIKAHR